MPSVQVKDFPQELYDQLKIYAEANHRSMAQQLVVAAEAMLNAASSSTEHTMYQETTHTASPQPLTSVGGVVTRDISEKGRQERIARRKELFAEIHEFAEKLKAENPKLAELPPEYVVDIIRNDREGISRHTGDPRYWELQDEVE